MIKWTKKNPFGAHLLNLAITVLIVLTVSIYFMKRYGVKIEQVYKDTRQIRIMLESVNDTSKFN